MVHNGCPPANSPVCLENPAFGYDLLSSSLKRWSFERNGTTNRYLRYLGVNKKWIVTSKHAGLWQTPLKDNPGPAIRIILSPFLWYRLLNRHSPFSIRSMGSVAGANGSACANFVLEILLSLCLDLDSRLGFSKLICAMFRFAPETRSVCGNQSISGRSFEATPFVFRQSPRCDLLRRIHQNLLTHCDIWTFWISQQLVTMNHSPTISNDLWWLSWWFVLVSWS